MPSHDHARPSRRGVLQSSLTVPWIAGAAAGGIGPPSSDGSQPDPVLAIGAAWRAEHEQHENLILEWQRLERQVFRRARDLNMSIEEARGRRFPELAVMRAINRAMDASFAVQEKLAREVCVMRAASAYGAWTKVDLGLRVQGRYGWQPSALELLEDGTRELGFFLTGQ